MDADISRRPPGAASSQAKDEDRDDDEGQDGDREVQTALARPECVYFHSFGVYFQFWARK